MERKIVNGINFLICTVKGLTELRFESTGELTAVIYPLGNLWHAVRINPQQHYSGDTRNEAIQNLVNACWVVDEEEECWPIAS